MGKVSHKTFIRNWRPRCHFCTHRTVRARPLGSYVYLCDKCLGALSDIVFSNAGDECGVVQHLDIPIDIIFAKLRLKFFSKILEATQN